VYTLERKQIIPRPRHDVFAFFADAANLERMTPPFLKFQILTPQPIAMRQGARIDYRISLHGIGMTWKTEIEAFEPERRFVDVQLAGPYRRWRHTHTFIDVPGGTEIGDHVDYELGFAALGRLVHALVVKRQLAKIFDYRAKILRERFTAS
jgi:ligand-binding SRPBCC domain-containing protein